MLITYLCALTVIARPVQPQLASSGQLEKLGRARKAFEDKVVAHPESDFGEENIYSMGPGEQKVCGYYPLGRSDVRYLVYDLNGWQTLLCQRIEGKHAKRLWRLALQKTTHKSVAKGTLARVLERHGVEFRGRIPKIALKDLNQTFRFAAYGYDGDGGLYAWTITSDGSLGPEYYCGEPTDHSYYPIVPDEACALTLGTRGWPPEMKFRIAP